MDPKKLIISLIASGFAGQIVSLLADIFPKYSSSIISLGMAAIGAINLYTSPTKVNGNGTISQSGITNILSLKAKQDDTTAAGPK